MHVFRILVCLIAALAVPAVVIARDFDPGARVIVKFRAGSVARMQPSVALRTLAADAMPVARVANADVVRTASQAEADALIARLSAHPDVEYAVRDTMLQRAEFDDPWYWAQADLYDPVGGVSAPAAWAKGATGRGIVVAVIDTGITAHPDLDANVVAGAGYDFITDAFVSGRDSDARSPGAWDLGDWEHLSPYVEECAGDDSSWHGSHVAGTVAAIANNGNGIAGLAHEAKILPVRVLGHCGGYTSDIAAAITWASGGVVEGVPQNATPAEVINLSLGGPAACPAILQEAIDGAVARGTTVVAAAGNSNRDVAGSNPANCRNVIAVGSTGLTGRRAFYSNYGAGITIAAPGGGKFRDDRLGQPIWKIGGFIWSTIDSGTTTPVGPSIGEMAGTSQAAPHVAAIVAMMQSASAQPHAPATIAGFLVDTARMFPLPVDQPLGAGIADAGLAVEAAILGYVPLPPAQPLANGTPKLHNYAVQGQARHYRISVPEDATRLTLRTFGGIGDADLYVRHGAAATKALHDVASVRPGNNGIVIVDAPTAGDWHIALHGAKAFSGVSVRATVE